MLLAESEAASAVHSLRLSEAENAELHQSLAQLEFGLVAARGEPAARAGGGGEKLPSSLQQFVIERVYPPFLSSTT